MVEDASLRESPIEAPVAFYNSDVKINLQHASSTQQSVAGLGRFNPKLNLFYRKCFA